MSPVELLAALAAQNIKVSVAGDKLKLRAPRGIAPELVAQVRHHKRNIIAVLAPPSSATESEQEAAAPEITSVTSADDGSLPVEDHPARNIIAVCQRYGVALRIDDHGDLVVGKAGAKADEPTQPWPTLLIAINAHLEAVAVLVQAGWHLRATFPNGAQA